MELNSFGLEQLAAMQSESRLLEQRTIFISEGINSAVAKRVINHLLALDGQDPNKPINMFINSPGGEVNSGFAIYDTMRFIRSEVRAISTGLCASIATIIQLGARKENRLGMTNAKFLIHQPLIGGYIQGPASDLEITAREIIKTRKKINELLAKECGQPMSRVEEDTSRDYWMDAKEAVEYGLIAKVVEKFGDIG